MYTYYHHHSIIPFFNQITSLEINKSTMESVLSTKITSAVDAFSHLKQVIIYSPTTVRQFPHIKSIPCLKLLSIPSDCDDWQWLEHVQCLSELHATVRGTQGYASITSDEENVHCFTVNGAEAKLTKINEEQTSLSIAKVIGSLPEGMREKVTTRSFLSSHY